MDTESGGRERRRCGDPSGARAGWKGEHTEDPPGSVEHRREEDDDNDEAPEEEEEIVEALFSMGFFRGRQGSRTLARPMVFGGFSSSDDGLASLHSLVFFFSACASFSFWSCCLKNVT